MPDGVRWDQELPKTGRCFSETLPPRGFLAHLGEGRQYWPEGGVGQGHDHGGGSHH